MRETERTCAIVALGAVLAIAPACSKPRGENETTKATTTPSSSAPKTGFDEGEIDLTVMSNATETGMAFTAKFKDKRMHVEGRSGSTVLATFLSDEAKSTLIGLSTSSSSYVEL